MANNVTYFFYIFGALNVYFIFYITHSLCALSQQQPITQKMTRRPSYTYCFGILTLPASACERKELFRVVCASIWKVLNLPRYGKHGYNEIPKSRGSNTIYVQRSRTCFYNALFKIWPSNAYQKKQKEEEEKEKCDLDNEGQTLPIESPQPAWQGVR